MWCRVSCGTACSKGCQGHTGIGCAAPWGRYSTAQRPQRPLAHKGGLGPPHLHLRRDQALHLPLAGIQHSLQLLALLVAPGHALRWHKDTGTHSSIGSCRGALGCWSPRQGQQGDRRSRDPPAAAAAAAPAGSAAPGPRRAAARPCRAQPHACGDSRAVEGCETLLQGVQALGPHTALGSLRLWLGLPGGSPSVDVSGSSLSPALLPPLP